MFRISQYMKVLHQGLPLAPKRSPKGPVVIWNLVRRCNLTCRHCYSISADVDFPGELSTAQALANIDDLKAMGVPALILSGGEPLLRHDIFALSQYAKSLGMYLGLSSNGTLITDDNIDAIAAVGYDYVGISIDGLKAHHDEFRQMDGGFEAALRGVRLCGSRGLKVGLRFTLTQENARDLPALLGIMVDEGVEKFYLSHLNYAGRGKRNAKRDAYFETTRQAMDLLFEQAWADAQAGHEREYVTGNNDADGVYLLHWARRKGLAHADLLEQHLRQWGGNSSGVNIANIDNTGQVHPDTFWWSHDLGSIKEQPFSRIWRETRDPLMLGLRQSPRPLKGRCAACAHLVICGGNTRVRAFSNTGDYWAEDPGCYLDDGEIGLPTRDIIPAVEIATS